MSENKIIAKIQRRETVKKIILCVVIAVILAGALALLFLPYIIAGIGEKVRKGNDYTAEEIGIIEDLFHIDISDGDEIVKFRGAFVRDSVAQVWIKCSDEFRYDVGYKADDGMGVCINSHSAKVGSTSQYSYSDGEVTADELYFYVEDGSRYAYCRIDVYSEDYEKVNELL